MLPSLRINGTAPTINHIDQYAGFWAIEESAANLLIQKANAIQLNAHVEANHDGTAEAATNFGFDTVAQEGGNVAIVAVSGTMTKYGSSFSREGSTLRARKALRNAINDPAIKAVLMHWETPGGTVAGTKELADEISAASKKKPVWSYCDDLCASAGYWGASHASKVFANEMAIVGSIGTFMVIDDYSKMFEDAGVKVHVIRAGDFKGSGTLGTEITEEQLAEWQSKVDQLNTFFTEGVKKHRGFSSKQISELADGRVHIGQKAKEAGLIDGVQTLDKTLAALSKEKPSKGTSASVPEDVSSETKETSMADATEKETSQPSAATYKEIVKACDGCDPKANADDAQFVADCQEQEMTVAQSQKHWMQTLGARVEAREQEAKDAREAAAKDKKPKSGLSSLKDNKDDSSAEDTAGDPISAWESIIEGNMKSCGNDRGRATSKAVRENPEAHQAFLEAYNQEHRPVRQSRR